jgi:VWFA-related protein
MTARRLPLVLAIAAIGGVLLAQQQPPTQQQPTFRGGIRTVAVPATVLDEHGTIVTSLGRDDFLLFDDNRQQPITNFESGQQPISALLLVDTSASMIPRLDLARQAAEQFIVRLWPGDRARVGSFSDRVQVLGDFTSDRDVLLRQIRQDLHIGNPTRLIDAIGHGMSALSPLPGRRVLVVITDGCDTYSDLGWDALLGRLPSEEFMVYAVQVGGPLPRGGTAKYPPNYRPGGRGFSAGGCSGIEHDFELSVMPAESLRSFLRINDPRRILTPRQVLARLTSETGGGHFTLTAKDDVNTTFTHVMYELHHQYLIGFTPPVLDGRKHTIAVRVKNLTLSVRARKAYIAPKGGG